jgi:glutamine amidotransferase
MIGIVNYGVGNIGSISNMLDHLYLDARVIDEPDAGDDIDRYILPGVGAFDHGREGLASRGLDAFLESEVLIRKKPVLGICLGMQLLTRGSDEGALAGLGWVRAATVRLAPRPSEKIPNMGWREITVVRPGRIVQMGGAHRYYFVHSYGVQCENGQDVVATIDYAQGCCVAFEYENIFGVQFHPEKSHRFGMSLLKRFAEVTV